MDKDLTLMELRVLGSLIEKEITTPEHYPLSLNALMLACNQKSNREPVLSLSEAEVMAIIDELVKRFLVAEQTGFGSRVVKYKHKFCNSLLGELQLSPQQLGVLCVLFLRGPQTPGEIRTRSNRLCEFSDVSEVDQVLAQLMSWESGALVCKFPREAGKRESRFGHLFGADNVVPVYDEEQQPAVAGLGTEARIDTLEEQIEKMQADLERLQELVSRIAPDQPQ